jgi:hypothetical protein
MADSNLRSELADLITRIERHAYQRGWNDAIRHVVSAAEHAAQPMGIPSQMGTSEDREPKAKASYGSVPMIADLALAEAGERGVLPSDVVAHGRSLGEDLAESSVRRVLGRMVKAGTATKERGRYFLVQRHQELSGQEEGDAETSPSVQQGFEMGGFHAAA